MKTISSEPRPSQTQPSAPRSRVSVVLVMPGPKNGMTLMTQRIVDALKDRFDIRFDDIGRGYNGPGRRWQIRKAWQSLLAGLTILRWKPQPNECLYLTVNSHGGLIYNLWHCFVARRRGFRLVLHHHCWSYLHRYDRKMQWLVKTAGNDAVHVIACPDMLAQMRAFYGDRFDHAFMTPGIIGQQVAPESIDKGSTSSGSTFRLGMLSNLTKAKGTIQTIETFERLRQRGLDVSLTLAGPVRDPQTQDRIDQCAERFGDAFKSIGPVYGDAKFDFYNRIDAFIFPTQYANESWGIVLNEALMVGVPVLTYRRGCIGYLVGKDGGVVVERDRQFPDIAADQIQAWMDDSTAYQNACRFARRRGSSLFDEAHQQLDRFIDGFASGQFPTMDQARLDGNPR